MEDSRKKILELLQSKAALKQDIHFDTLKVFDQFKKIMHEEVEYLRGQLTDNRIRMQYIDKGEFEAQIFVGSDLLFFHMHTNVFLLPDDHPFWKQKYFKEDRDNGYFGVIYIYNFLAQSVLQGRDEDPGYLIARIFVNKEGHFFIEGQLESTNLPKKNVAKNVVTDETLRDILYRSFCFATEFELLVPPFELMSQVNVMQIQQISSNLKLQTGKRLGFQFSTEETDFYTIK